MNFEKISADNDKTESENERIRMVEEYYKQFQEGLPREAEIALQQIEPRSEYLAKYLKSKEASEDFKELYEKITDIIKAPEHIPAYTQQILEVIKDAPTQYAKKYPKSAGYDKELTGYDYDMEQIRKALEKYGIPLKNRKTSLDL